MTGRGIRDESPLSIERGILDDFIASSSLNSVCVDISLHDRRIGSDFIEFESNDDTGLTTFCFPPSTLSLLFDVYFRFDVDDDDFVVDVDESELFFD